MSGDSRSDDRVWRSHPVRATLIRIAAFAIPLLFSMLVGVLVGRLLPRPQTTLQQIWWWIAVLGASTAAVYGADKVARRLLPLATLMRLSMLFPDRAPKRFKVARRVGGSRAIEQELHRAQHAGLQGDRQEAAETILALVGALGDYDSRTRGHSERTQLFVTMLADELRLREEDKGRLMWAALVHDIGKLRVPHDVLNKPGKPSDEEWEVLHTHPFQGAQICEPLREWLGEWWFAIEQHHEKYDGSGYPLGLAGAEISYGARIVAVADSYEVMTASRPYKRPMTAEAARQELTRCAGTHFDPDIVRAFLNISLGGVRRSAGPFAWLAQILLVRPGPLLGRILGVSAGASAAAASVIAMNLPAIAGVPHDSHPIAQSPVEHESPEAPSSTNAPPTPDPDPETPTTPRLVVPTVTPPRPPDPTPPDPTPTEPTTDPGKPTNPLPTTPPPPQIDPGDDTLTTDEDLPGTVDVLANDAPPAGQTLVVSRVSTPQHGSVSYGHAAVIYTPAADFNGPDWFTYTARDHDGTTATSRVDVTVRPVDDFPIAFDDSRTLTEDAVNVHVDVLANDTDVDGDVLTIGAVGAPAHGSAHVTVGGKLAYTPTPDYHGSDTFTYTAQDPGGWSSTGIVAITVTPQNDAPVAAGDSLAMAEDSAATTLDLLSNDTDVDGDALSVTAVTGAAHGTVSHHADGSWTYRPDPDFNGPDSLVYTVSDGQATDTDSVSVTVTPVQDAPVAVGDGPVTVDEDAVNHPIGVLANDNDVDGDALSVASVGAAAHGTANLAGAVVTYTPAADYNGPDSFTYVVQDGNGGTDTATVDITVRALPDGPIAVADTLTLAEDASDVPIDMLGNDTDADGDTLSVTSVTGALHGTVTQQPDGSYTYLPEPDYAGADTLTYTVSDGNGGSATGTVNVTVTPVNDAPVTGPDAYAAATTDIILTVNAANGVLANDVDVDGDTLTVVSDDSGAININADGSITYVLPLFGSVQTVHYVVTDGTVTTTGTAVFTVTLLPTTLTPLFMQPVDTVSIGDLATAAPPAGGPTDPDNDGQPGLTIKKSDLKENENDPNKFQMWQYNVPGGGVTLSGPIRLDLWTQINHAPPRDLEYAVWVYDCDAGGSCSSIASAVNIRVSPWSTTAGWEERMITVGTGNTSVPGGHTIRVRIAFDREDVWLGLDSAHPSSVEFTF